MKLFDITKRLTEGVVGGKISHKDSYANRYKKTIPTYDELMNDQKAMKLLRQHAAQRSLALNKTGDDKSNSSELSPANNIHCAESMIPNIAEILDGDTDQDQNMLPPTDGISPMNDSDLTDDSITRLDEHDDMQRYCPSNSDIGQYNEEDRKFLTHLNESDTDGRELQLDFDMDDPILDVLKKQLMMNSSSKEEVAERRRQWREIGNHLENTRQSSWTHFENVFAVSSVTGRGIERLRVFLGIVDLRAEM